MRLRSCLLALALVVTCAVPPVHAGGIGGPSIDGIAPLVVTGDSSIDIGQRYALSVLAMDFNGQVHAASSGYYSNPWVRDSFAWGMIDDQSGPSLRAYSGSEIHYWLLRQQKFGGWITAAKSGYFDETAIFISAVLEAYKINRDRSLLDVALPAVERGWTWLATSYIRPARGSRYLIYANVPPHIAADWVDQIARSGYATELEALWYKATADLAELERSAGRPLAAARHAAFAVNIKKDINRLLWTDSAPYTYLAPSVPAFGHYRSWLGPRDYFELDSNALCVVYGIAGPVQARSIAAFISQHAGYLLGLSQLNGVPARIAYGEYSPLDYAWKRNRIGQARYQNASWPSVGALVAIALLKARDFRLAQTILERIGTAAANQGDIREWYGSDGLGDGAPHFQWAARMYLIAVEDFAHTQA